MYIFCAFASNVCGVNPPSPVTICTPIVVLLTDLGAGVGSIGAGVGGVVVSATAVVILTAGATVVVVAAAVFVAVVHVQPLPRP